MNNINFDNWKLNNPIDDGCEMVSDCCGSKYELWNDEKFCICSQCGGECITIESYEYKAIQKENYLEDNRNE